MKKQKDKWKIIVRRLIDVFIYLLISIFVFVLMDKITLIPLQNALVGMSASFSDKAVILFLVGTSLLTWGLLIKFGGAPFTLKNFLYLPTWLIGIIGTLTVIFLISIKHSYPMTALFFWHSSIIVGSFIGCKIFFRVYGYILKSNKEQITGIAATDEPQAFLEWALSDAPISSEKDDRFERVQIARNMAQLIKEGKNIALVGDYGVGKTTILNWMSNQLMNDKTEWHYTVCKIDSWGRRHNELTSCLLKYGLRKLKKRIDILSFVDIPEDFINAVSSGNFWSNLFRLAKRGITPIEVLRKLDDILFWHNEKLIFIIEDIDRNIDEELIQVELPSLLDRLSETDNILFVIAIDVEYMSPKWLYRVTDNIQNLPDLDPGFILSELDKLRKKMLAFQQYIDPNSLEEHLSRLVKVYDVTGKGNFYIMPHSNPINEAMPHSPAYIIAILLSNPRTLKTVFQQTYNAWKKLIGEVNCDELLVLNTIRYTLPIVNHFLLENITQLQAIRIHRGFNQNGKEEGPLKALHNDFAKRISGRNIPIDIDRVNILIDYLFSGWITYQYDRETISQSIALSETPYWNRINKEYLNEKSIKDQEILSKLANFQDNVNLLAEQTVHNSLFALKIQQFSSMLKADEKLILASAVFDEILEQHKVQACREINGFNELRKLIRNDTVPYEEYYQWIIQELEKALPVSFRFANDLLSWLGRYESDYINVDIYIYCVNLAKQTWSPETLVDVIDVEFPYSLFYFTVLYSSKKSNTWQNILKKETPYILKHSGHEYHFFPKYWQWLAKILMEGVKIDSKKILPQISYVLLDIDARAIMEMQEGKDQINEEGLPEYTPHAEWFSDLGELWFGDDFIKLVESYANFDEYSYQTEEINIRMTFMKNYAIEYLKAKRQKYLTQIAVLIDEYTIIKLISEEKKKTQEAGNNE